MNKLFARKSCLLLFLIFVSVIYAQESERLGRTILSRARLKFDMVDETPQDGKAPILKSITITDPAGQKEIYWYFRYKITNDTSKKIAWRGDIKIVIDKTRDGVPEHKVPGLFYNAELVQEKDGDYYLMAMETREGNKNLFWEVTLFQDVDNDLSLISKNLLKVTNLDEYELPLEYNGENHDPEIIEKAQFVKVDMDNENNFDVAEINKMAMEILPLLNPNYNETNFVKIHKAAKQIGLKEFNAPKIYLGRLKTYYDTDLPVVKNEIMQALHMYPRLSPQENLILIALEPEDKNEELSKTAIDLVGVYYAFVLKIQTDGGDIFWEVILHEDLQNNYSLIRKRRVRVDDYNFPRGFAVLDHTGDEIIQKAKEGTLNIPNLKGFSEINQASSLTLSYEEAENALVDMVVRKLVLPEETDEDPVFVDWTPKGFEFLLKQNGKDEKIYLQKDDKNDVAGWELLSYEKQKGEVMRVTMKKRGILTSFYPGASLEYKYVKTYRYYMERDIDYASGMSAKGKYKGRTLDEKKPFDFDEMVIYPKEEFLFNVYLGKKYRQKLQDGKIAEILQDSFAKNSTALSEIPVIEDQGNGKWQVIDRSNIYSVVKYRDNLSVFKKHNDYTLYGLAIFPNISPEMDYAAIVVSGLVDPIVRRKYYLETNGKLERQLRGYLEDEVYLVGYKRPGDEFYTYENPIEYLYEKWMVLSRKQVNIVRKDTD